MHFIAQALKIQGLRNFFQKKCQIYLAICKSLKINRLHVDNFRNSLIFR